jgi:membrane associated rhomboid family serine protease
MSFGSHGSPRFGFGFHVTPWVKRLLIANGVVFLVMWILGPRGGRFFIEWFAFHPSADFLTRPWGALTYMFVHGGGWHLLMNMLFLFFFGPPLEGRWGGAEFLRYYVICGLGGAFLSFVLPGTTPIIGASAAVLGLLLAFAWFWPNAPIYIWAIFPVKAKWLVAISAVLVLMSSVDALRGLSSDGIAHFAHLGGLLAGLVYLKWGGQLGARLDRFKEVARMDERFAIVPGKDEEEEAGRRPSRRAEARMRRNARREEDLLDEVDRILDKISASGMGSLTPDERKVLDEVSRKRRSN